MVAKLAKALRTSSKELKKIKEAADKVKKNKSQPATQKGLKLSKNKDIRMPDKEIETPVVVGKTGITKTGEKINVGTPEDITRTIGSKKHAERKVLLQSRKDKGIASKSELAELAARRKADVVATRKQQGGRRTTTAPQDDFKTAQKMLEDTGEMGAAFERLTKNQQDRLIESTKLKKSMLTPEETTKKIVKTRMRMDKGGMSTKKRIGTNDYRKGGYVLSSVDNRKNKRK